MFNTILIILLINSILNYIFKVQITTLNCGNFAWAGKVVESFDINKYKILGLYNESRGKHSCGMFVDGKVKKGIGTTALFSEFISSESLESPKKVPVVIGHTRQSSVGVKNLANTHPFIFDKPNGNYFVGSHNGTLKNHTDLAYKYDINTFNGSKIDSEILLEILSKYDADVNDNIKVLAEYEGAAAIVFHDSEDSNILYVFRGKSETDNYYSNAYNTYGSNYGRIASEERPLFYWQENDESMYISSIKDSLKAISNCDKENIHTFETNTIYKIVNGNIESTYKIDRVNSKKYERSYTKSNKNTSNTKHEIITYKNKNKDIDELQKSSVFYENVGSIINDELTSNVIFERFRFRRNGHTAVDGCYVYIDGYGLQYVELNPVDAKKQLKNFEFYDSSTKQIISLGDQSQASIILMVDGLIINSVLEYTALINKDHSLYKNRLHADKMSHMSRYPVLPYFTNKELKEKKNKILVDGVNWYSHAILNNGIKYTGIVKPICSNKSYHIKDGKLNSTTTTLNINSVPSDIKTINLDNLYEEDDDTFEKSMDEQIEKSKIRAEIDDILDEVNDHVDDLVDLGHTLCTYAEDPVANAAFEMIQDLERNYVPLKKHLNINE